MIHRFCRRPAIRPTAITEAASAGREMGASRSGQLENAYFWNVNPESRRSVLPAEVRAESGVPLLSQRV